MSNEAKYIVELIDGFNNNESRYIIGLLRELEELSLPRQAEDSLLINCIKGTNHKLSVQVFVGKSDSEENAILANKYYMQDSRAEKICDTISDFLLKQPGNLTLHRMADCLKAGERKISSISFEVTKRPTRLLF